MGKHSVQGGLRQQSRLLRAAETELISCSMGRSASSASVAYITFLAEFSNTFDIRHIMQSLQQWKNVFAESEIFYSEWQNFMLIFLLTKFVVSNELIKVELKPWKTVEDVSRVSPSAQAA